LVILLVHKWEAYKNKIEIMVKLKTVSNITPFIIGIAGIGWGSVVIFYAQSENSPESGFTNYNAGRSGELV
jgi:hypothetical protein